MIELKRIKIEDLKKIMDWRMSPDITKYMYTDPILTLEGQKKWFEKISQDDNSKNWVIYVDNIRIGFVSITNIDYQNKHCILAWYIGEGSYRGMGIGKQIQLNLLDYVFNKMKFNKFYSEVLTFNESAIKLHLNCGFDIEGKLKQHIYKNDEYLDVLIMSITSNNWEKTNGGYTYQKIKFEE